MEFIEHEKGGHVSRPKKELPPSPPVTPSATEVATPVPVPGKPIVVNSPTLPPVELQYKWVGFHKDCNSEVKTITVDLDEKQAVIAYCVNCDKKLKQETVVPIALQLEDEEPTLEEIVNNKKKK